MTTLEKYEIMRNQDEKSTITYNTKVMNCSLAVRSVQTQCVLVVT